MKVVVVIPTYNEAENIGRVLSDLESEFRQIKNHEMEILVVDGRSPDRTAQIVGEFASSRSFVHLIEKDKEGLGADYLFGMKFAMNELKADAVIEMDADLQHDPRDIKRFVAQIDAGYDYVIGSRYIEGGSIPGAWAFYRRFLSVVGNFVARLVLWLPNITDYTTGFRAARVKGFLDSIDFSKIYSKGYAYKIHILSEMIGRHAKVKEIPITFGLRSKGISKMEGNNPIDSLLVILRVRVARSEYFLKYLAVGFVGLTLQVVIFQILRLTIPAFWAAFIGGFFAIVSNFILNNIWTFKEKTFRSFSTLLYKFAQFLLISSGALLIQFFVVFLGNKIFGSNFFVDNLFFFLGLILVVIWNFFFYSKVIWKVY